MANSNQSPLDRLRQPEYTGENRCAACTVVNSVIGIALAGVVGGALTTTVSTGAGLSGAAAVLGVSALSIGLRGYLVPGTPTLTKRYLPDRVLAWFGKDEEIDTGPAFGEQLNADLAEELAADDAAEDGTEDDPEIRTDGGVDQPEILTDGGVDDSEAGADNPTDVSSTDGSAVENALYDVGALDDCEDREDLCLTEDFQEDWSANIETLREQDDTSDELGAMLGVDGEELEFTHRDDAYVAKAGRRLAGQWESEAAHLADVAAAKTFREREGDDWSDLELKQRSSLLNGLRVFVEDCPSCGGAVSLDQDRKESCCRAVDIYAVTCEECNARIFETQEVDDDSAEIRIPPGKR